jgi:hypothetical protein
MLTTIKLYTIEKLKEHHPETYIKLYKDYKSLVSEYPSPWSGEVVDCLKAFVEFLDFKLVNYSLSSWHSDITVCSKFDPRDDIEDLCGPRAYAYIMNRLDEYRVPYGCKHKNYKNYRSYGYYYKAGKIKPAPLTGYYLDDMFIEKTLDYALKRGTLREAIESLSSIITESLADDIEQEQSEESFEVWCQSELFTSAGTKLTKRELELQTT